MKEYGRKPYLAKTYREMMTKKTNAEVWADTVEKHSEFEKPYIHKPGEYNEMQHYHPHTPGITPWIIIGPGGFEFSHDFDEFSAESLNQIGAIFFCSGEPCYCPNDTRCTEMGCTYPIVDIIPYKYRCDGLTFSFGNGQLCVTAGDVAGNFCSIDIVMAAKLPNPRGKGYISLQGMHRNVEVPECDDCYVDPCEYDLAWDYGGSASTIDRSSSVTVAITGTDGPPFYWGVSGAGFTLDYAQTTGLTNTLNASSTACGTARITVSDGCMAVDGYVRCLWGQWTNQTNGCAVLGKWDSRSSQSFYKTKDQYKQYQLISPLSNFGDNCDADQCAVSCAKFGDFLANCLSSTDVTTSLSCSDYGFSGSNECTSFCCDDGVTGCGTRHCGGGGYSPCQNDDDCPVGVSCYDDPSKCKCVKALYYKEWTC